MESISGYLLDLLKQYAIEEGFIVLGKAFSTVSLLYLYASAALICLAYVVLSLIAGGISDLFSIDDDGAFPAVAIGMGAFASFGGLSLFFFKATPIQSVLYGAGGGACVAVAVMLTFRWLASNESNMIATTSDFEGCTGTCSLRIRPGQPGQIEVSHNGVRHYLTAYSKEAITVGERVRIQMVRTSSEVDVEKVEEDR